MTPTIISILAFSLGVTSLENALGVQYGIKSDSMISYDGVYLGYAPDWCQPVTMSDLNQATGQKGATYNVYSQITPSDINAGAYTTDQFPVDDIISSGAVLIASIMPEVNSWSDISTGFASSVASYLQDTFLSKGVTVWLRFAHEMNCYSNSDCTTQVYPSLGNGDFFTAWSNMRNAMSAVNGSSANIYMFWSPNVNTTNNPVEPWWPGADQVDIVGIDDYPPSNDFSFTSVYGDFYNTYAAGNGLPFAVGETGYYGDINDREGWLQALINPGNGELSNYPLYMSATWFEYGNDTSCSGAFSDQFFVVYDQSESTVTQTISNTENGSS